jgi:hypothetical protein
VPAHLLTVRDVHLATEGLDEELHSDDYRRFGMPMADTMKVMKETLFHLAKEYIGVIEKIERTSDPARIQSLEEKRAELHWKFIDLLKAQGIKFKDREHATRIAIRIANGELRRSLRLPGFIRSWSQLTTRFQKRNTSQRKKSAPFDQNTINCLWISSARTGSNFMTALTP